MIKFENTYIMQLEAKNIKHNMDTKGVYDVAKIPLKKLYIGSLPFSLELLELDAQFPTEIITVFNKSKKGLTTFKQYTNAIIDVKFDYSYLKMCDEKRYKIKNNKIIEFDKSIEGVVANKNQLRSELYKNGFKIKVGNEEIEYVKYARSSSKARTGHRLFIKKELYDYMSAWKRMDITYFKTKKMGDLAGLLSYESLTLSGLESLITIDPNTEILLVDDIKTEYKSFASVTEIENGELVVNEREVDNSSNVFDGESLADESLFPRDVDESQHSMLLLRNRFFKSAIFNAKVQDYFKDHGNPKYIPDKFGNEMEACKIKLITTPSSLKLLKYATIFKEFRVVDKDGKVDEKASQSKCYDFWREKASKVFGVCKHDKGSKFMNEEHGGLGQLSYQIINSLPLSYPDVVELAQYEIEYVNALKTDINALRNHIKAELHKDNTFLDNLLTVNDDFAKTNLYISIRDDIVETYRKNLKRGHIKISNTDLATLLGNPIELMRHAMGEKIVKPLHYRYEAWCSSFADGEEMVAFRSPHICSGNVAVLKNTWKDEFKYLNLSPNIIVTNSWDCDLLDRLQGADMDSDFCVVSTQKTILNAGKKCLVYPTPINGISPSAKERSYNTHNQYMVDRFVSDNLIGKICNLGQIYNSYYWQEYNSKNHDREKLKLIYDQISILSSLSQIAIDSAKKTYDVKVKNEFENILNCEYNGDKIIRTTNVKESKNNSHDEAVFKAYKELECLLLAGDIDKKEYADLFNKLVEDHYDSIETEKAIKPMFFKYVSDDKKCDFRNFDCPMDYVLKVLKKNIISSNNDNVIDIGEVLGVDTIYKMGATGRRNRQKIIEIAHEFSKERNVLYERLKNEDLNYVSYCKEKDLLFEELVKKAPKKISAATVLGIFCNCYSENKKWSRPEMKRQRRNIVRILYELYIDTVLDAVKSLEDKREAV